MIAFIGSLKNDTCTPKPAKFNAWVCFIAMLWCIDFMSICFEMLWYIKLDCSTFCFITVY